MASAGGPPREVRVRAERAGADPVEFDARVRIDTPARGRSTSPRGILQYVLRELLAA